MNETRVTTDKVRLSYVHLFKPFAKEQGQEPKFSVTILLPKSDTATKSRIDAAIEAAKQKGTMDKWNGVCPPIVDTPIHDGDGVRRDGTPYGPECKGHWVFTATSRADRPIEVVDANLNPIIDQTQIYSGIYGRVSVNFAAYYNNGNKGIGCYLGPVQKLSDGEVLGGGNHHGGRSLWRTSCAGGGRRTVHIRIWSDGPYAAAGSGIRTAGGGSNHRASDQPDHGPPYVVGNCYGPSEH